MTQERDTINYTQAELLEALTSAIFGDGGQLDGVEARADVVRAFRTLTPELQRAMTGFLTGYSYQTIARSIWGPRAGKSRGYKAVQKAYSMLEAEVNGANRVTR